MCRQARALALVFRPSICSRTSIDPRRVRLDTIKRSRFDIVWSYGLAVYGAIVALLFGVLALTVLLPMKCC
jgi:hypothetical protein